MSSWPGSVQFFLKMNGKKTDFILVGSKQNLAKSDSFTFDFNGTTFHRSEKFIFFRVSMDETLGWEAPISIILKKCNSIFLYHSTDFRTILTASLKTNSEFIR